jgi:rod shape-determining protein MreC
MATGRDDFVIAFRSAILKKKDKQRFSLLTLIFLSIFVIILSNFDIKVIRYTKFVINELVYRSSYLISIPENKIQKIKNQLTAHLEIYNNYQEIKSELNILKEEKLTNEFLKLENKKLRNLINESVSSEEILAKVLIDKESPYLKSIVLNKGSKDNVKIGMAIMDGFYLAGKVIEVNYTSSRALLLSDLNSKIPVMLLPDRIQAVVSGTGKNYGIIEYTKEKKDKEINEKDRIIYTSGFAGLFKSGIPIGRMFK